MLNLHPANRAERSHIAPNFRSSQWADVESSVSAPTQLIKEETDGLLSFMASEVTNQG